MSERTCFTVCEKERERESGAFIVPVALRRYPTLSLSLSLSYSSLTLNLSLLSSPRRPEPHILLFRRPLGTDPRSGTIDPDLARKAKERYFQEYGLAENAAANPK